MSLLRSIRNVAVGYTATQVKVRNATSNDESSPSTHEMREIAELTYNNQELFFIMDMIDKRLNDKGKNWRHVLKSLNLLEFLVLNGSENVIIWCHAKFYVIKTLREFQYRDESGKDYGNAIRARAKELVSLLNNNERLKDVRRNARGGRGSRSNGGGAGYYGSRSGRRHQDRFADRSDSDEFLATRTDRPVDRPSRYRNDSGGHRAGTSSRQSPEVDDDMRRAIELSKQTVQDDERRRAQLRNASSEDISKAMNISQATDTIQQHQTGLYTQEDWNNYQRAQQEYLQYQEQLAQQQQLEQQLAQQQQALAQQQQEIAGYSQSAHYTGQTMQHSSQATGHTGGAGYGQSYQDTGYQNMGSQNTGFGAQNTVYQSYGGTPDGSSEPQMLQPVKTGSNNPFAMQNTGYQQTGQSQPQHQYQQQPQQYQNQYQQQQYQQSQSQQSNNPFQQQYTGIATTQMQPSHTGFGFGNAQNQRGTSDSLIDL